MSMSFSPYPCPSPPPPMPSPVLVPMPLQTPPPLTKKPSRSRLSVHPPASVKKTLSHALSHDAFHRPSKPFRSTDDPLEPDSRAPLPSMRTIKRTLSHLPSRRRSPPPSPAVRSPPPPVPPIPAFVLTTNHPLVRQSQKPSLSSRVPALDLYLDRSREDPANMRCESKAGGALTCMQFLAVHNQTGQCGA